MEVEVVIVEMVAVDVVVAEVVVSVIEGVAVTDGVFKAIGTAIEGAAVCDMIDDEVDISFVSFSCFSTIFFVRNLACTKHLFQLFLVFLL